MFKNKKGFTLIEIVIVIVIIAILAAMLVPNLVSWIDKAKLATLKSEADTVKSVIAAKVVEERSKEDKIKGTTQDDFDDEFWADASKESSAGDLQCTDSNADGYVQFSVGEDDSIIKFEYHRGNHIATYDGGVWQYE